MEKIHDLLIIGSGAAGLSAALYAGRAQLDTVIFEKEQVGGQAIITSDIVNYPGIAQISGPELMMTMQEQATSFGAQFVTGEIQDMDLSKDIKVLQTTAGEYKGYAVLIATGATPRKIGYPGEETFGGRGISYCATCDGHFFKGLDVFVIGGGYSAAEEGIYLTRFAREVHIMVRKDSFSCAKTLADHVLSHPKIKVHFNTEIVEAKGSMLLEEAVFKNNKTGETFTHKTREGDRTFGIFMFAGYIPTTGIFKGHVALDPQGYIPTDENMLTNVPGVYAAGDLRQKILRQLVTAAADGAIAATEAEKHISHLKEKLA
jgi:thioredoxin reductase (NADPH)